MQQERIAAPMPEVDVLKVAEGQKLLLWAVLAGLLGLIPDVGLIARLFVSVALYRLTTALGSRVAILWAILGYIPLVGVIILLKFNADATKLLQKQGLTVGLMGVSGAEIARLRAGLLADSSPQIVMPAPPIAPLDSAGYGTGRLSDQ